MLNRRQRASWTPGGGGGQHNQIFHQQQQQQSGDNGNHSAKASEPDLESCARPAPPPPLPPAPFNNKQQVASSINQNKHLETATGQQQERVESSGVVPLASQASFLTNPSTVSEENVRESLQQLDKSRPAQPVDSNTPKSVVSCDPVAYFAPPLAAMRRLSSESDASLDCRAKSSTTTTKTKTMPSRRGVARNFSYKQTKDGEDNDGNFFIEKRYENQTSKNKSVIRRLAYASTKAKSFLIEQFPRQVTSGSSSSSSSSSSSNRLINWLLLFVLLNCLVYFWPIDARLQVEPKVAPPKARPKFVGALEINEKLDELGEKLFENQFHAPESMAWTSNKRAFFTGVEGGFILYVEPYAERWTIAARLNARRSVEDESRRVKFVPSTTAKGDENEKSEEEKEKEKENGDDERESSSFVGESERNNSTTTVKKENKKQDEQQQQQALELFVPFCTRDVELYGPRAEFEPSLVKLSRCSRPLGIRLAPNDTHLYVMDPLSGLYRIELSGDFSQALASETRPLAQMNRVRRLLKLTSGGDDDEQKTDSNGNLLKRPERLEEQYFADDIAVEWGPPSSAASSSSPSGDVIYMTDCSRRWSLRYLFWLMLENDDSGRVLKFDASSSELSQLTAILPVSLSDINNNKKKKKKKKSEQSEESEGQVKGDELLDERGLSFPNGLELTANGSALLISDLNNRRILMHFLRGPSKGTTKLLMHVPGYSDNIRRGLDTPAGTPTYWFACGCAVGDGRLEIAELANEFPFVKRLLLRWLHSLGTLTGLLGRLLGSTSLIDAGFMIDAAWLKVDPYCTHGLVGQFNEQGEILRSLHGPSFSSNFKLLSEAHQVPLLTFDTANNNNSSSTDSNSGRGNNEKQPATSSARSLLYLGSVYYSYLGRLELAPLDD